MDLESHGADLEQLPARELQLLREGKIDGKACDIPGSPPEEAVVFELRGRRIIITVLSLMAPGGEEVLTGSSLVRAGEAEAVAKAVLDAMNRRFSLIVRKPLNRRGPDDPEPCQER